MNDTNSTNKVSTAAQRKAVAKYHSEKIDTLSVRVPKGRKDYYKVAAASVGQSLNQFAVSALDEKIAREGIQVPPAK